MSCLKPFLHYRDEQVTLYHGDCLKVLAEMPDASIDAVVTDPPYGLEFMGKDWDRPWAVTAECSVGYEGREGMTLPSHRDGRNANCRACGGRQRGKNRCTCERPQWDRDPAADLRAFGMWCESWAVECLRVLRPGGHLLAFGGSRTWHRLACAVEDAGFEIRDSIAWLYGSGFPKSLDVSKAIDKAARGVPQGGADPTSPNHGKYRTTTTEGKRWDGDSGQGYGAGGSRFLVDGAASGSGTGRAESGAAETACEAARQWQGWGTALKPAFEPIVVARKPLAGTVAANVLEHGTGALNIDGCRVGDGSDSEGPRDVAEPSSGRRYTDNGAVNIAATPGARGGGPSGRWPTNVVLDDATATELDQQTGILKSGANPTRRSSDKFRTAYGDFTGQTECIAHRDADEGGASRFFPTFRYEAKADTAERPTVGGIAHPTVKPLDLMRWLVRLVTPPNGVVLDPFAGSGTTAEACIHEHKRCIAIEREGDYLALIVARLNKPMAIGFDFESEGA